MENVTKYDLTSQQKSLYNIEKVYTNSKINNITFWLEIDTIIDFKILNKAINYIIQKNDNYRLQFVEEDGELKQFVREYKEEQFEILEVNNINELEENIKNTKFDLAKDKLYVLKLFRYPNGTGGLVGCDHHLISDAWTMSIFINQIMEFYNKLLNSEDISEIKYPSYIDYVEKQKEYENTEKYNNDKIYWKEKLNTKFDKLIFKNSNYNIDSARIEFDIDSELLSNIREFCNENKISEYVFFLSIYCIYFGKLKGYEKFIIGNPILNRSNFAEKNTSGLFMSTLPFLVEIKNEMSFLEYAKFISSEQMAMYKHLKYPDFKIIEDYNSENSEKGNLYDIVFSYQNAKANKKLIQTNIQSRWVETDQQLNSLMIHFKDTDDTGKPLLIYDYLKDVFSKNDIQILNERIMNICKQAIENNKVADFEIVLDVEKDILINKYNDTYLDYDRNSTIVFNLENTVKNKKDEIALVYNNSRITYDMLNKQANKLARYLQKKGVSKNQIIPVIDSRSIEMIISMLAIMKLGCAYVPIDIDYPKERIKTIIEDINTNIILTRQEYKEKLDNNISKVFVNLKEYDNEKDENLEIDIDSNSLAYLIYTSGTTGKPKGVMITHKNVINFIEGTSKIIDFNNKTIVSVTTISFDIFVLESWLSLIKGAKVVIANNKEQNISYYLNKLCLENNVQMIQTTPSRMKALISDIDNIEFLKNMTDIMVGGESVPLKVVNDIKNITTAKIFNMYGPTETTVWSTIKDLTYDNKITIGKPISNTKIHILNKDKKICPIGVEGNLYIGGDGVGKGYYNNEKLTNEKFIINPYNNNELIYDTGDIAKWNNEGNIICLGRNDFQVKINGHRIEIEEIENVILKYSGIEDVAVVTKDNTSLIAVYTANEEKDYSQLRKFILDKLPIYMVPNKFIKINKMPKTNNGKLDRKKILKLIEKNSNEGTYKYDDIETREPKNEIERVLVNYINGKLNILNNNVNIDIFQLGMDSLGVIDLCNNIHKIYQIDIEVKDIFNNRTIENIATFIQNKEDITYNGNSLKKHNKKEKYRATIAQKRIFYATKSSDNELVYNMPFALILNGELNIKQLESTLNKLVERHEALRTEFLVQNGELYQKVKDKIEIKIELEQANEGEIFHKYKEFVKPFNLEQAPLIRFKLVKINLNKYVLLFDMHHIISDGSSINILINELSKIYNGEDLVNNDWNYIDYSEFENENLTNGYYDSKKEYWLSQFEEKIESLNMNYDYSKNDFKSYNGAKVHEKISNEVYEKIKEFSKENKITPYMIFLAVYYILISRYTSQENIVIGTPVVNRNKSEFKNIIGMFVNDIPMKSHIDNEDTFISYVNKVKDLCLNSFEHADYPNGEIISLLKQYGKIDSNKLFDTMFIYQNSGLSMPKFNKIEVIPYMVDSDISKYDFSLEVMPDFNNREYILNLEYATDLFKKSTMQKFLKHYNNILIYVLNNKQTKICDIEIIDEEEKNRLLYEFNNTDYIYDKNIAIHQLIEKQALRTPNEIALVFENEKITYKEMDDKTNQLARYLRKKGINRDDIIGVMVPRSLEMLIGIIGILKSGACYMPIDITYPKERIQYMLENSNAKYILTKDDVQDINNAININSNKEIEILSKEHIESISKGEDLAYVIYTSGSTGKPKGVMVKHKGISNLAYYSNDNIDFLKDNVKRNIVSVTTMSFDIFVFETLIALQKGLTVVIANEDEQRIPSLLNKLIEKNKVEIIQTTPSRMQMLVDYKQDMPSFSILKYIVLIGEPFTDELLKDIYNINPNIVNYNTYGPTETTVFSTMQKVSIDKKINIGFPIYNTKIYVLDENKRLLPIGHVGELYIGGEGVSRGYYNNKETTANKFISNPYREDDIIYATGDLVRFLDNGELECLGRIDNQVKIRGLRIELGEIESAILNNENVEKAIVVDKKDKENRQYLSAYFIANKQIDINIIRKQLERKLPRYMIPTHISQIKEFKYTPNGKIDKKYFKELQDELTVSQKIIKHPNTQLQIDLQKSFSKVLNLQEISIDDSFFDLGGDSILAMKLQIELMNNKINITFADIFKYPTIEKLEERIIALKIEETNNLEIEDFSNILEKCTIDFKIANNNVKNVLLTGATGYVGIHILASLMENGCEKVYCLIRSKKDKKNIDRLKSKLNYYFNDKYNSLIDKRIIVIEGDITREDLGIENKEIIQKIDAVINSAAKVTHYGNEKEFNLVNVIGVKNLIKYCIENNKKLFHISTLSVSGNTLVDQSYTHNNFSNQIIYKENDFYVNQPIENLYVKTKFLAENEILKNINNGLDAYIFRLGNIMGRYSDGVFQQNIEENAYINRLKVIYNIGVVPNYIMNSYLEFTPVDICAEAITKIINNNNSYNRIFHIYNNNHIYIKEFLDIFEKLYKKISVVNEEEFINIIDSLIKKNDYIVTFLLNDMDENKKLVYDSNIKINGEFTNKYLEKLGFKWPIINEEYIKKFFDYLFKMNFFQKEN